MTIYFLSVDEVIELQERTLTRAPCHNRGALEGAINRVFNLYHYELERDIFTLAAAYTIAVAKAHAFPDGDIPLIIGMALFRLFAFSIF